MQAHPKGCRDSETPPRILKQALPTEGAQGPGPAFPVGKLEFEQMVMAFQTCHLCSVPYLHSQWLKRSWSEASISPQRAFSYSLN